MSARVHARLTGESGSTLVVAVMVMAVAVSLSLLIVGVARGTGDTTGNDRGRLVAVNAAEASIDAAYASIQSSGLALPCTWPAAGSEVVKSFPEAATTSATITYVGASGATACPLAAGDVPVRAIITGTGATTQGRVEQRTMEALVDLKPVTANGLSKALFGESLVSVDQSATVTATGGESADVYTNGNFACSNSPSFQGNVYAPTGSITMLQTCGATGDVWSRDNVKLEGNKTIGGRVLSSLGSIAADGNTTVNGTLIAAGNITWDRCTTAKCLKNQSAVPAPPQTPFPRILSNASALAEWTAQGYTIVDMPAKDCTRDRSRVELGDWVKAQVAGLTGKTLFRTPCHVTFENTKDTPFGADVAIFANKGISTTNQVGFRSGDNATVRNVHLIQPYDSVAAVPCTTNPINGPSQQFSSTAQIHLLWYSPCSLAYANLGGSYGQVYSGSTLSTNNAYTLHFRKVPVWGLDMTTQPTVAYSLDVVYKRETR